jgi:hypothetical protein
MVIVHFAHLYCVLLTLLYLNCYYFSQAKRITIVFRGSVFGGGDWPTNVNALWSTLETPEMLQELGLDEEKEIQVHSGFKSKFCFATCFDLAGVLKNCACLLFQKTADHDELIQFNQITGYLIDNTEPPHNETKIQEIVDNLMEIYDHQDAKDYRLYVSGHR